MAKKTAQEKLAAKKNIKKVRMEKDFAGIKAGELMLVATPQIVDTHIQNIPYGETQTIAEVRDRLAAQYGCDKACPLSTSIFVRISAEAALEDLASGLTEDQITPFWRVLGPKDKITKKIAIDPDWVEHKRLAEKKG